MSVKELRRVHVLRQTMDEAADGSVTAGDPPGADAPPHPAPPCSGSKQAGDQRAWRIGDGASPRTEGTCPEKVKARALKLYARSTYGDFGPTLAAEKLTERQGITVSAETVRRWLLATRGDPLPRGGSARIGRGGNGKPMWGHSSNWMARTMTGSRGAGPGVC